jgi:hypothetical protein
MAPKAKTAKKVVRDIFEAPAEIGREAARQMGILPRKEDLERERKEKEVLKKRAQEERTTSLQMAREIEREIKEMVKKRQQEKAKRKLSFEEPEKKSPKPLAEPKTKKPRGLVAGLRARLQKSRPELAGRRTSG